MQTFSTTPAGRIAAPQTRRAADVFPSKALPGVSLQGLAQRVRRWQARRAERASLSALLTCSEHLLDDIGVTRDDLAEMLERL